MFGFKTKVGLENTVLSKNIAGPQFCSCKKIGAQKKFGSKKNFLSKKEIWSETKLGPKNLSDLRWKTTFGGRQSSVEDNLR